MQRTLALGLVKVTMMRAKWILGVCALGAWALSGEVQAKPRALVKAPKKEPKIQWPLTGERLPIKAGYDADVLNERWEDVAKMLEVSDLRVRHWPHAFNFEGGPARIQKRTLEALRASGYRVEEWDYEGAWGIAHVPGFDAVKGAKRYTGMWLWNGSHLMLYWGTPKATKK